MSPTSSDHTELPELESTSSPQTSQKGLTISGRPLPGSFPSEFAQPPIIPPTPSDEAQTEYDQMSQQDVPTDSASEIPQPDIPEPATELPQPDPSTSDPPAQETNDAASESSDESLDLNNIGRLPANAAPVPPSSRIRTNVAKTTRVIRVSGRKDGCFKPFRRNSHHWVCLFLRKFAEIDDEDDNGGGRGECCCSQDTESILAPECGRTKTIRS